MEKLFTKNPNINKPWTNQSFEAGNYEEFLKFPNKETNSITYDQLEILEEYFSSYIDEKYPINSHDTCIDGFEDYFQFQNFHPYFVGKNVDSGAWVKVKTDVGYNIYWAKNAPKKRMSAKQLTMQLRKAQLLLTNSKKIINNDDSLNKLDKSKAILNDIEIATLINEMPVNLKYVKIMITRTKSEFLLPYQYEVVNDIFLYTNVINDKMNKGSVKYKSLFTSKDEDQIFYLQSRGIDRDTAVLMCKLQQIYFVVDVQKLFNNWMQPFKI